jgi:hypothetical protein
MKLLLVLCAFFILFSFPSKAEVSRLDIQNEIDGIVECSAYISFTNGGLESRKDKQNSNEIKSLARVSDNLDKASYYLSAYIDMKQDALLSKYKIALDKMGNEIGKDYANFSILIDKYAEKCKTLVLKYGA